MFIRNKSKLNGFPWIKTIFQHLWTYFVHKNEHMQHVNIEYIQTYKQVYKMNIKYTHII